MRAHRFLFLAVAFLTFRSVCASAQSADRDAAPNPQRRVIAKLARGNGSFLGLGDHVLGPIDVQTPTVDNGCLGVEAAFGFFYVSGRLQPPPNNQRAIYKFDTAGSLLATFPQLTHPVSAWGHRDLESDDSANIPGQLGHIWGGQEVGHFVRYAVDGAGNLDAGTAMSFPALGTIRALALDLHPDSPRRGHFWTANFTSSIIEFDESGQVYSTITNPGKTVFGMALDPTDSNKLWLHSQDGGVPQLDAVQWSEFDIALKALTGKTFQGISAGTTANLAGGGDIYADATATTYRFISLHQSDMDQLNAYDSAIPTGGSVTATFCTAKPGLTCGLPAIDSSGTSSATAGNGFVVSARRALSCRVGILLLSQTRIPGAPFHGGTLCVQAGPGLRAAATNSGGTPGSNCDGLFSIDVNAFAQNQWPLLDCTGTTAGTTGASPAYLRVPGTGVFGQMWGRDSLITGTYLSDGLGWVIGP